MTRNIHRYHSQPQKGLYLIYHAFALLFVRLPFWILVSIPRGLRPHPEWTLVRCLWTRLIPHVLNINIDVGGVSKEYDSTAIEHPMGVWIEPCLHSLVVGSVAESAVVNNVVPIRLPGYWQNKPGCDISPDAHAEPGERVFLHLHGGAYIAGSAHPSDPMWTGPRGIMALTKTVRRAFAIEYRLSNAPPRSQPTGAFPSGLIDTFSGYLHLLRLGFAPENIIVIGNSAGGSLAHALARYLVDHHEALSAASNGLNIHPPGMLILLSPWADMGSSHDIPAPSYFSNTDFLTNFEAVMAPEKWAKRAFVGSLGLSAANTDPYISPASKHIEKVPFVGFPRTHISWGGCELFAPGIRTLNERMKMEMGEGTGKGQVVALEAPLATHDVTATRWVEPEMTETTTAIAKWVDMV